MIADKEHLFIISRWAYSVGESIIEDAAYNILFESLKGNAMLQEYYGRSWSSDPCPIQLLRMYGLDRLIESVVLTEKTDSIPSLTTPDEVYRVYGGSSCEIEISVKLDGWNFQVSYNRFGNLVHQQTRGRKGNFFTFSSEGIIPPHIEVEKPVTVVGELVIPDHALLIAKRELGITSQRSGVITCLKANRPDLLQFVAFTSTDNHSKDELDTLGFTTPRRKVLPPNTDINLALLEFGKEPDNLPSDGVVLYSKTGGIHAARVYRWEEPVKTSFVTGYHVNHGPTHISYGVQIYPTHMGNSIQRRVTVTNMKRLVDLDLRRGAPIAFRLSSHAVADVDEEVTKMLHAEMVGDWEYHREAVKKREGDVVLENNLRLQGRGVL